MRRPRAPTPGRAPRSGVGRRLEQGSDVLANAAVSLQTSLARVDSVTNPVMSRIVNRQGTLGLLVGDTMLYVETRQAVVQLRTFMADIQANPQKYFKLSVFWNAECRVQNV